MRAQAMSRTAALAAASVMCVAAAAAADTDYWFHVRVDEDHGAKVTVNLPLALFERALPMIPEHHLRHGGFEIDHWVIDRDELRGLWAEVASSPDMAFVTVEDRDQTVKVWKEKGYLHVRVDEERGDEVDVRLPLSVVDAWLGSETGDLRAAVSALVAAGGGELVTVRDRHAGDSVRVWIDRTPEAE